MITSSPAVFLRDQGPAVFRSWLRSYATGLEAMARNQHDVCLVDYRLGARNGIELLREAHRARLPGPHHSSHRPGRARNRHRGHEGRRGRLSGQRPPGCRFARTFHSLRHRAATRGRRCAAAEQARLAAFGADVGLALTRARFAGSAFCIAAPPPWCSSLNAALARIWIFERGGKSASSSAPAAGVTRGSRRLRPTVAQVNLSWISIAEGKPVFINQLAR